MVYFFEKSKVDIYNNFGIIKNALESITGHNSKFSNYMVSENMVNVIQTVF